MMKKYQVFYFCGAILLAWSLSIFCSVTCAQSEPTAVVTQEREAFDKQLTLYKESLKKLRSLKEEFQTAAPERKDAILDQFTPLVQQAEKEQKELIPTAIATFNKGEDKEVAQFLYAMLQWATSGREDYETAYQIAKAVLNGNQTVPSDILYAFGAYSAFNVMELDDAEKWFKIADEKNAINRADPENQMHIREAILGILPRYRKIWEKEQGLRVADAGKNLPRVLVKTSKGNIVIELFKDEAPNAVGNFLTLVSNKFYDGTVFHRVLPYFMAQGGDPTGTGSGGPGYSIPCECSQPNARMHFRGSLSMAHAGPDTGGSQFFLTFVPTSFLNGKHTVFGRVIEGMEVLSDIQRIDPEGEDLPAADRIIEAKIIQGEPYEFKKLPGRR